MCYKYENRMHPLGYTSNEIKMEQVTIKLHGCIWIGPMTQL